MKRLKELIGDTAYDSGDIRAYLRKKGIKTDMARNPRSKLGRPYRLDVKAYRLMKGCVERFFA